MKSLWFSWGAWGGFRLVDGAANGHSLRAGAEEHLGVSLGVVCAHEPSKGLERGDAPLPSTGPAAPGVYWLTVSRGRLDKHRHISRQREKHMAQKTHFLGGNSWVGGGG